MIRSVWDDAGYDASVLVEDQCLFDTAALLVTKLFLSGVDSRSALAAKLECQLGRAGRTDKRAGYRCRATQFKIFRSSDRRTCHKRWLFRLFDCQRVFLELAYSSQVHRQAPEVIGKVQTVE